MMAKRSASSDKLTIRNLSQEDQDWLKTESERLGCDPENLVRMMIRQRSAPVAPAPVPPDGGGYRVHDHGPHGFSVSEPAWADSNGRTADPSLETVNAAEDPSLDALMSASPSLLDEPPNLEPGRVVYENRSHRVARVAPRNVLPMQQARSPYPRGGMDAFTETEFVGVNQSVIGSNSMGDARNNVMRDNLRHFGVAGTRHGR